MKRARLSVVDPVALGSRVKAARVAAGLTQGEVAHGELSVSYLSRIESGKRRPDVTILDVIAERLRLEHETLLPDPDDEATPLVAADDPTLDFAEIALEMGDPETALTQLGQLDLDALSPEGRNRAEMSQAKAFEATGDLNAAVEALESLLPRITDEQERVPMSMMLSRCHRELGELSDAIRVGEHAVSRASGTGLEATEGWVQLTVTVAAAYFEQGDLDHALRLCRRALGVAETLSSPSARASAYWETSMITMEKGEPSEAVDLARRALALMSEGAGNRILTRLRAQVGLMELKLQPPDVASARANFGLAADEMRLSHSTGTESLTVGLGLARCDLLDGDAGSALAEAQRLLTTAASISPLSEADVFTLIGEAAAARGDVDEVRRSLLQAVHRLHAVGSSREAGQRWLELAVMLQDVGEIEAALTAYRAAAASAGLRPRSTSMPNLVAPGPAPAVRA